MYTLINSIQGSDREEWIGGGKFGGRRQVSCHLFGFRSNVSYIVYSVELECILVLMVNIRTDTSHLEKLLTSYDARAGLQFLGIRTGPKGWSGECLTFKSAILSLMWRPKSASPLVECR